MHFTNRILGRTGIDVSPLGLATGKGSIEAREVERAFERGINYFYWGSYRASKFGEGFRTVAKNHRANVRLVVQSYTRSAGLMRGSLERALKKLDTDYTDLLLLGWWNQPPPARILDAALALKERGLTKHLMISCHDRNSFAQYVNNPAYDAIMVRYNAVHPGAETEVFPRLGATPVGVVSYTATRWGHLLDSSVLPENEPRPTPADCYRFVLTNSAVNITMCAPRNGADLDQALATMERGPMSADELAWMKRVGVHVKKATAGRRTFNPIEMLDRTVQFFTPKPTAGLNTSAD